MSFKVTFVYNGYTAEVTSETPEELEMDITECRVVLHKLPPCIPARALHSEPASDAATVGEGDDKRPVTAEAAEIIRVTEVEKTKLKNGSYALKIRGGKYESYGVMLYPDDCLFKDDLSVTNLAHQVVSGIEAKVIRKDGKLRVAAVRRVIAHA